jgi:SAM-dependent methyltransferase
MSQFVDRVDRPVAALFESRLRCCRCGGPVEVRHNQAVCENEHAMAFRDGYLDTVIESPDVVEARTLESFGYEWVTFDAINPEDERFWRWYVADLDLAELADRVGIDVGCGKGRYTRFTARHLTGVVALDGSDAVVSAVRNLQDMPNTMVIKATIDNMPVAKGSFGFVSCLGVLHHLSNPRAGFDRVAELLAPGGLLLVYLYSRPVRRGLRAGALAAARLARHVTVRMPHPLLRLLCVPTAALLHLCFVMPGRLGHRLGMRAAAALPLAIYRDKPLRSLWLDTFDRLSAPIENRYVWTDIAPWFAAAGLNIESVRDESGLFIVARRPAH